MLKRFRSFWDVMLLSCRNMRHKCHCESASGRRGNLIPFFLRLLRRPPSGLLAMTENRCFNPLCLPSLGGILEGVGGHLVRLGSRQAPTPAKGALPLMESPFSYFRGPCSTGHGGFLGRIPCDAQCWYYDRHYK